MRISFINKIIGLLVLLVFTYTSCNFFTFPEILPSIHTVPVGLGNIGAVFLDENYQPTTNDIGRLAIYAENNKYAENVMVIAEIPENHIDNDIYVTVINNENKSIVTFYYNRGQYFPDKMVMKQGEHTITGRFSMYNHLSETYSVVFSDDVETARADNLTLNKNVFTLHEESDILTETQNERLQKIYTTLALWTSMAVQLENFDDGAARAISRGLKSLIVGLLVVVAIAALTVAALAAPAVAIIAVGPVLPIIGGTVTQVVATAVSIVALGAAALCHEYIPVDLEIEKNDNGTGTEPPQEKRPKIEITYYDETKGRFVALENNFDDYFYLNHNDSITFHINIENFGSKSSMEDIINTISLNNLLDAYDPNYGEYVLYSEANATYFNYVITVENNKLLKVIITRNTKIGSYGDGSSKQGKVQFILPFKCDVIINDVSVGLEFKNKLTEKETLRKDIFVFNFTVINPN